MAGPRSTLASDVTIALLQAASGAATTSASASGKLTDILVGFIAR